MTRAVAINTDGTVREMDGSYESIKAVIGGWLEIAPTPGSPFVMFVNEEGKINRLPFNERADRLANQFRDWHDPLMGNAVLVGLPDREGENTDFTLAQFLTTEKGE